MKLHWLLKLFLWAILVGLGIAYAVARSDKIIDGSITYIDAVVILLLFALLISPLFSEVDIFGVKLKNEIRDLKSEVKREIASVKNEIRTAVDFRSTTNTQFTFAPLPDDRLKTLEDKLTDFLDRHQNSVTSKSGNTNTSVNVSGETNYLFSIRYNIEKELRRIWTQRIGIPTDRTNRAVSFSRVLDELRTAEVIDWELSRAIREVYSVTSPAVHGETPSAAQLSLARDVGPRLIAALRELE